MPRNLYNIKGNEALRVFEKNGGVVKSGKGDHINIKMPNGMIITIPGNKILKIGLLKAAIRKAGLTDQQFLEKLD
ncbi:MAG: type II toxin-antitoxin system HicA family toxin [Melioribacter sp.]|nr:type II toxin-antitoxin system HicA family toxin [Melioribacter sp.]